MAPSANAGGSASQSVISSVSSSSAVMIAATVTSVSSDWPNASFHAVDGTRTSVGR